MLENFQLNFTKILKCYESSDSSAIAEVSDYRSIYTLKVLATFSTMKIFAELQKLGVVSKDRIPKFGFFDPLFW